jgi:hypothetical protein
MAPNNNPSPPTSVADVEYDEKHAIKDVPMHLEGGGDATFENRNFSTMTAEDRATALRLAHEADPGPGIFSYRFACFIATCFVVIVNSCDTGFDTTIMSSVNSMTTFQRYFGLVSASKGTGILFVSIKACSAEDLLNVAGYLYCRWCYCLHSQHHPPRSHRT